MRTPDASHNCQSTPNSGQLGGPAPYWEGFSYDSSGDRKSEVQHATSMNGTDEQDTYTYPSSGSGTELQSVTHATAPAGSNTWTTTGTDNYAYTAGGQTKTAPGQTIGYNDLGEQTSTTVQGTTQTSVYDANGNLLTRSDPIGGTVAYLGDTELTLTPTGSITASRTFEEGGTTYAVRTTTGGTSPTLTWIATNAQGTANIAVNPTTAAAVIRHYDPFGNSRDAANPTWPTDDGFLNKPDDALTADVQLGARTYAPNLGRFLTVDPVLGTNDPQALNGYAYTDNNPTSESDPSGLRTVGDGGSDNCMPYCGPTAGGTPPPPGASGGGTGHGTKKPTTKKHGTTHQSETQRTHTILKLIAKEDYFGTANVDLSTGILNCQTVSCVIENLLTQGQLQAIGAQVLKQNVANLAAEARCGGILCPLTQHWRGIATAGAMGTCFLVSAGSCAIVTLSAAALTDLTPGGSGVNGLVKDAAIDTMTFGVSHFVAEPVLRALGAEGDLGPVVLNTGAHRSSVVDWTATLTNVGVNGGLAYLSWAAGKYGH